MLINTILTITSHPVHQEAAGIATINLDFNTDFSTHLPRYQKAAHPCYYCRSKGLECFIHDCDGSGPVRCSPCNALFRPCSFVDTEKMPAIKERTALDTLDVVAEDNERCSGGLTGVRTFTVYTGICREQCGSVCFAQVEIVHPASLIQRITLEVVQDRHCQLPSLGRIMLTDALPPAKADAISRTCRPNRRNPSGREPPEERSGRSSISTSSCQIPEGLDATTHRSPVSNR
jgi:hypothetical protein